MMNAAVGTRVTPDDLLELPDWKCFELVDGDLEKRNMGAESSWIAQVVNRKIANFSEENGLGLVFGADCGYQIFTDDPDRVRIPDGSFIRNGRLPNNLPPRAFVKIPPDLAIEVVSPNDLAEAVEKKVQEYRQAQIRLIWVIYPETRHVNVYRLDGSVDVLGIDDELPGEDVLPGFSCPVHDLFPTRS